MKDFYVRKRYIFLSIVLITMGLVLVFMPARKNASEISPENMLLEIIDETRFLSVDEVAKMIIEKDPSIQLIDLREPEEFKKFSLPNAINIPLKNILDKENAETLNQDVKKNILFANGSIYANQAWTLMRRHGYKNNYVLKGGLNDWFETIIQPKAPKATAPKDEFDRYAFRKAASMYFGGGGTVTVSTSESTTNASTPKAQTGEKKKKSGGGGC